MTWEKLPPYTGDVHQGCLLAPAVLSVAPMDMLIAVGFGAAEVTRDDELVYSENKLNEGDEFATLQEFEDMALADPDHDWQVLLDAPLRMCRYQRQDVESGYWLIVDPDLHRILDEKSLYSD